MAGKPKPMSQIKQLLRLHKQGNGQKFIASALGISRNTVKAYLQKVKYAKLYIDKLLSLEDPELEKKFFAGSPAYKEPRYGALKDELPYYVSELKRIGVTKQLLWEEYREKYPNGYSRSQFYYHLGQYQRASKPTMVLEHKAGEKLYVDFAGKKMHYTDPSTGEIKECEMFVASMPYSDYSFAMAVKSQTTEDFLYALSCCFEDFGGVPEVVVTDNLKASVIKADRYEPDINRAMEDFANHYGFTLLPARVCKPQDKALVENLVNIVYSRVYARLRNDQFFSIDELNSAIKEKIELHNQTRMQNQIFGEYIEGLFKTKRHPEQLYKSCDGLLKIERSEKDKARFDKACEIALSNGIFGYKRLSNILKNDANFIDDETSAIQAEDGQNGGGRNENFNKDNIHSDSTLPSHGNIRGSKYYGKIVQAAKQLSLKLFTL